MTVSKTTQHTELHQLAEVLDDALNLLDSKKNNVELPVQADAIKPSLFDQCIELCQQVAVRDAVPIRTIHNLSCTGGTLISKCLAAMPNVMMLNEVDPLSTMTFNADKPSFTPTDILSLIRQADRYVSDNLLIDVFLQNLNLLQKELSAIGKSIVIRDHSHSHFLTGQQIHVRPTLRTIVKRNFQVLSVVTVRDPVDCFLSMEIKGWLHFKPGTFDEYCRRYNVFLDMYENVKIFKYEDFICDPTQIIRGICDYLRLSYVESFIDTFDTFKFSGDSGRKGSIIELRPRREMSQDFTKEAEASQHYRELVVRLGY
jgi:hypothetical protein